MGFPLSACFIACWGAAVVCVLVPNPAHAQAVEWFASSVRPLKGDTTCVVGQRDCNPCAHSVLTQFTASSDDRDGYRWGQNASLLYPPEQLAAMEYFNNENQHAHVQGFVRTYNRNFPYAGSHSQKDGRIGSIFLVEGAANFFPGVDPDVVEWFTPLNLSQVFWTQSPHPSGLSVLGQYLVFADGTDNLRFVDLERQPIDHYLQTTVPGLKTGGGGLAIVKSQRNGYLLVASDNISKNKKKAGVRFYHMSGEIESPAAVRQIGSWDSPTGITYERENLDLVTECGTGDIYAIHSSTWDHLDNATTLEKRGIWRLWKVSWGSHGTLLEEKAVAHMSTNDLSCQMRAGSSVHVDADGEMSFYCHARLANQSRNHFIRHTSPHSN